MTFGDRPQDEDVTLEIQLDEDIAQGMYINLVMINHTDTEFTLDFIYVQPQEPKAKMRARVITSPRHAKQLLFALKENLSNYEEQFGEILVPMDPGRPQFQ